MLGRCFKKRPYNPGKYYPEGRILSVVGGNVKKEEANRVCTPPPRFNYLFMRALVSSITT